MSNNNKATIESADLSSTYIASTHTYHDVQGAQYVLPNGVAEHMRLETQAGHLRNLMHGKILHAPVAKTNVQRVLDIGCGTGIVTQHFSELFPQANIYGLDLSPVPDVGQRQSNNVQFLQGNVLTQKPSEWLSSDKQKIVEELPDTNAFDIAFSRLLICGLSEWDKYFRDVFALLKPRGFMEIHDLDWIWYDKAGNIISHEWTWLHRLQKAAEDRGMDFECGSKAPDRMRAAGFTDVQVHEYYWPFGGQWEKTAEMQAFGNYVASAMVGMLWHMIPRTVQDASPQEIEELREAMRRDFAPEEGKHWKFYVVVGSKPA